MTASARRYSTLPEVRPSARTEATTDAADRLRAVVDELKLEYRLTAAELAVVLTGELTRAARNDLEFERVTGRTAPLALRFIRPATEDAAVVDADACADTITDAALHNG